MSSRFCDTGENGVTFHIADPAYTVRSAKATLPVGCWDCRDFGYCSGAMDFIACYSVEHAIIGVIRASRGEILAVHPAHVTANLVVCANLPGYPVIRTGFVEVGALYGIVLMWEGNGVIQYLGGSLPARQGLPGRLGTA